jgi:hypothetical protein
MQTFGSDMQSTQMVIDTEYSADENIRGRFFCTFCTIFRYLYSVHGSRWVAARPSFSAGPCEVW